MVINLNLNQDLNLNLQIMHAADDYDISWRMGLVNFETCVEAVRNATSAGDVEVEVKSVGDTWGETMRKSIVAGREGNVKVEWTLLMQGGHNRIVADVPVALAVMKGFGL